MPVSWKCWNRHRYGATPRCEFARQCGGCQLQAMTYEAQLDFKAKKVWNHLTRIGGLTDLAVPEIIGMEDPWRYRNKAQFPFGTDKEGNVVTGFYAARSHKHHSLYGMLAWCGGEP